MKVAYYLTVPPPPDPSLDAAFREVDALRRELGGPCVSLYPAAAYHAWLPRRWLRRHQVAALLRHDGEVDIHHLATDRPIDYPVLRRLRRPLVCRLLLTPAAPLRGVVRALRRAAALVVSSEAEAGRLRRWGLTDVAVIPPGIELDRFRDLPAAGGAFTLLVASAPWTRRQFRSKGLDALLAALVARPELRLILLWRGVLRAAVRRRVAAAGLTDRVEILDGSVDVPTVLARAHAVVLAVRSPRVVKAYPHSLLEGLAAGRPVLTSPQLAIADLVRSGGAGVVTECDAAALGAGLDRLVAGYAGYREAARRLDLEPFSHRRYLDSYRRLYDRLAGAGSR